MELTARPACGVPQSGRRRVRGKNPQSIDRPETAGCDCLQVRKAPKAIRQRVWALAIFSDGKSRVDISSASEQVDGPIGTML